MEANEMISRWFINDTMEAGNYRLKEHAAKDFWRWLTSWAVCLSRPGDLGAAYELPSFELPKLNIIETRINAPQASIDRAWSEGRLMPDDSPSSTGMHKVKRESLTARVAEVKQWIETLPTDEPVLIWCDTDYEADLLKTTFPDATEVRGSTKDKEAKLIGFAHGDFRILITKPSIAGFGLNYQHCANQALVGVGYSFESFYQAVRRSHRFGQTRTVNVNAVYAETEGNIITILKHKQEMFKQMQSEMNAAMAEHGLFRDDKRLKLSIPDNKIAKGDNWTMILGDCVTETAKLPTNSIDFGIHSPPFANLYIYSDSEADMGNSADDDEFFTHYEFLIKELLRTTKPGRLCAIHCKDLPSYMNRDGAAGLVDFPGKIIKAFEASRLDGDTDTRWQYHSRVTIWKDPVIEMQRTKNHGLLHKNFTSTADAVRQGMPDYMIVFRKWPIEGGEPVKQHRQPGDYIGTEPPPVHGKLNENDRRLYSIHVWQRYASPVWFDIDQTNVLNYQMSKDGKDEKHICPLQLDVIARCVDLWTNKGETVFSPFAGIGSEGYESVKLGRKFIGIELKESYWRHAQRYLADAERIASTPDLFAWADAQKEKVG
jgi:DNA modification methylase